MKTIVAGVMLLLLFLVPDPSLAGSEGCARDFWGKCKGDSWGCGGGVHYTSHYTSYCYRHCAKDFWGRCADGRPRWRRPNWENNGYHQSKRPAATFIAAPSASPAPCGGVDKISMKNAKAAADDAWMVRCATTTASASQSQQRQDMRHNCDPSTPVSPALVIKKVYFRCVVEATPCRAPTGNASERYERRYEEDDNDDDKKPGRRGSPGSSLLTASLSRSSRALGRLAGVEGKR